MQSNIRLPNTLKERNFNTQGAFMFIREKNPVAWTELARSRSMMSSSNSRLPVERGFDKYLGGKCGRKKVPTLFEPSSSTWATQLSPKAGVWS
ncbi:hypothetical protein P7K49_025206 [Saguinus oedipus]|uniref:Uncharacterized protein n=1 Tax=Saguinus oedipus TaxID=9490 RepID=A0ABQ9UIQ5_SAGOE|nr:hypothetical protein P7K49_025206 [Saguinus oedipus]